MTTWDTLGTQGDSVELVPYDPAWKTGFELEAQRILQACGEHLTTVEHIGSTSIPGLAAKPIIDMMPGLRSAADGPEIVGPMEQLGYEYRGEYGIPGRFYFVRNHKGRRVVNGHAFPLSADNWNRHLFFRDHLRQNIEAAEEYEQLKRELAERFRDDVFVYAEAKTEFIRSIERLAAAR